MTALLRRAFYWAALALALVCWSFSITYARAAFECGGRAVLRLDGHALNAAAADALFDTQARVSQPSGFALWRQDDRQTVENKAFGRSCTVSVLLIRGDASLVLPSGAVLSNEDRFGCLIDQKTALALYGDKNPVGAELRYNERVYTIRGVFASPAGTVVLRAPFSGAMTFDRITLDIAGQPSIREAARQFAARHSLAEPLAVMTDSVAAWGGLFMRIPAIVTGAAMICILLARAYNQRAFPVRAALWMAAAAAVLMSWFWMAQIRPGIPQDWAPTRWSDFEFWVRLFEERRRGFFEFVWMKKERPDILLLTRLGGAAVSGCGALLFWSVGRRAPTAGTGDFLCTLTVCLAGSLAGVLLTGGTARMLWFCIPFFFTLRRFLEITEKGGIV